MHPGEAGLRAQQTKRLPSRRRHRCAETLSPTRRATAEVPRLATNWSSISRQNWTLSREPIPGDHRVMTTTAQFPATTIHGPHFDGQVLTPGTRGYDSARSVWNGMIDHRPNLIVRCASVGDVVTAVRAARERDLALGVRCGGPHIAGPAVPHGARSDR